MASTSSRRQVLGWSIGLASAVIVTLLAAMLVTLPQSRNAAAVALGKEIVRAGGNVELVSDSRGRSRILTISLKKASSGDDWIAKSLPARETICNLNLCDTDVSDEGMAQLPAFKKLMTLNLAGTAITDKGFSNLKSSSRLKVVNVADTRVSAVGIAELKKALPGIVVLSKRPPVE
jgi:hypothetical protein